MKPISMSDLTNGARYSDCLDDLFLSVGGAKEVLRLDFESDYSGFVDCDVLLEDGRVFSYKYYYGSCSGCDEWESKDFSSSDVMGIMLKEATFFDDRAQYNLWREKVSSRGRRLVLDKISWQAGIGNLSRTSNIRSF